MKVEFEKLEETINQLKEELIQIVETTGLNSYDTLNCSQELDKHISVYQRYLQYPSKKASVQLKSMRRSELPSKQYNN